MSSRGRKQETILRAGLIVFDSISSRHPESGSLLLFSCFHRVPTAKRETRWSLAFQMVRHLPPRPRPQHREATTGNWPSSSIPVRHLYPAYRNGQTVEAPLGNRSRAQARLRITGIIVIGQAGIGAKDLLPVRKRPAGDYLSPTVQRSPVVDLPPVPSDPSS